MAGIVLACSVLDFREVYLTTLFINWCPRPDSNRHDFRHYPLKIACLPIPPLGQYVFSLQPEGLNLQAVRNYFPRLIQAVPNPDLLLRTVPRYYRPRCLQLLLLHPLKADRLLPDQTPD